MARRCTHTCNHQPVAGLVPGVSGDRQAGDHEQRERRFDELFDRHYPDVLAYARRRLDADAADDAAIDTFVTAWRRLDELSGDPLLWLYGLARGSVSNHRRRLRRIAQVEERVRLFGPRGDQPDLSSRVVWEDSFAAAFAQLSDKDREILRLAAWEGLSASDGARVLGCSPVAYKVRLHRARQRLRRFLAADGGVTLEAGSPPPACGAEPATYPNRPSLRMEHP